MFARTENVAILNLFMDANNHYIVHIKLEQKDRKKSRGVPILRRSLLP